MAKATSTTRNYYVLRVAEDLEGLGRVFWEDLGVEVAATPDEARSIARGRFPETDQAGIYVAIAEGSFKPHAGGKRQVWVDDETPVDPRTPNPPVHRDSSGKPPLKGQTDLVEAVSEPQERPGAKQRAIEGEPEVPAQEAVAPVPIPEAEVAVDPIPHEIVPEAEPVAPPAPEQAAPAPPEAAPAVAPPTEDEVAQAKAARDARIKENARKYAEAQKAGEAAAAPAREQAAEAVAKRMEQEQRTGAQVAEDLAATEAARKARVAAEKAAAKEETPAPVNPPADDGWGDPATAGADADWS